MFRGMTCVMIVDPIGDPIGANPTPLPAGRAGTAGNGADEEATEGIAPC
jgi:hypothetical protein